LSVHPWPKSFHEVMNIFHERVHEIFHQSASNIHQPNFMNIFMKFYHFMKSHAKSVSTGTGFL
jgi:hypothetical protein